MSRILLSLTTAICLLVLSGCVKSEDAGERDETNSVEQGAEQGAEQDVEGDAQAVENVDQEVAEEDSIVPNADLGTTDDAGVVGTAEGDDAASGQAAVAVPCTSNADCASNQMCAGPEGCDVQWTCQPQRACTRDLRMYCSCRGETVSGSGSCPPEPYSHRGPCEDSE